MQGDSNSGFPSPLQQVSSSLNQNQTETYFVEYLPLVVTTEAVVQKSINEKVIHKNNKKKATKLLRITYQHDKNLCLSSVGHGLYHL